MNDEQLEVVCYEKDLGVLISNDLKVSQQCQQAYNKASKILGLVNRTLIFYIDFINHWFDPISNVAFQHGHHIT